MHGLSNKPVFEKYLFAKAQLKLLCEHHCIYFCKELLIISSFAKSEYKQSLAVFDRVLETTLDLTSERKEAGIGKSGVW